MTRLNDAPNPKPPGQGMQRNGVSTMEVGENCPLGVAIDVAPVTSATLPGESSHAAVRSPRIPRAAAVDARFISHLSWRARASAAIRVPGSAHARTPEVTPRIQVRG